MTRGIEAKGALAALALLLAGAGLAGCADQPAGRRILQAERGIGGTGNISEDGITPGGGGGVLTPTAPQSNPALGTNPPPAAPAQPVMPSLVRPATPDVPAPPGPPVAPPTIAAPPVLPTPAPGRLPALAILPMTPPGM